MMIEVEQALADLEHQLVGKPHHRALAQVSNHEHHQYSSPEGAILADASQESMFRWRPLELDQ